MLTIIYDYFRPAYKAGGPIQSLDNLTLHLNIPGVKVICSNRDLDGTLLKVPYNKWVEDSSRKIFYSSKGFYGFKNIVSKDDILFINGIYSIKYNFLPLLLFRNKKIVSVRGMLHPEALSQKPVKKRIYLKLWKLLRLNRFCQFHATSIEEEKYIKNIFGDNNKVCVIPNLPRKVEYQPVGEKKPYCLILSTIALISPMKNHLSVIEALKQCSGNITYNIYGPVKDSAYWEQCKKSISELPQNIVVKYHGEIDPEYIPKALKDTHVIIQPSLSENYGHSIIEALMAGRPVITSYNTPWIALDEACAGKNVSANDIIGISAAISFFSCMDQSKLELWCKSSRDYALSKINVQAIINMYLKIFQLNDKNL